MIVCGKFSREFRDPPQPSLYREGMLAIENWYDIWWRSTCSLPKQGGLGWVSCLGLLLHPCGTRDTLPKRVHGLYTKAMWHPCTLKMKITRARAKKIINIVDKPETWNLKPESLCGLQSGLSKNVCAHTFFKYFNRKSGRKVIFLRGNALSVSEKCVTLQPQFGLIPFLG